jgi:diaminopimelate epimerase
MGTDDMIQSVRTPHPISRMMTTEYANLSAPSTCPVSFSKLNAAGNDFVCIDNTDGRFDGVLGNGEMTRFVQRVCERGLGVGADGLILACEKGTGGGVDIVARFLEPDGSEAKLCGNGTACFTYWLVSSGILAGPEVTIMTGAGTATGRLRSGDPRHVRVCVPNPRNIDFDLQVVIQGQRWLLDYADTGVPHAVIRVDGDLDAFDVRTYGPLIRWHERFAPEGVNANFVEVLDVGSIAVRTFEFGVEGETLACGTGSAAAAILTALRDKWPAEFLEGEKPVRVSVRSGKDLLVWFEVAPDGRVTDVCLETAVTPVYNGILSNDFTSELCVGRDNPRG